MAAAWAAISAAWRFCGLGEAINENCGYDGRDAVERDFNQPPNKLPISSNFFEAYWYCFGVVKRRSWLKPFNQASELWSSLTVGIGLSEHGNS